MAETRLRSMLERLCAIQMVDAKHKTSSDCMMSLNEEVGELAREIKIEDEHFGNTHKAPSPDGSVGEAIDVVIMGLAMYYTRHNLQYHNNIAATEELADRVNAKLDKWEINQRAFT